MMNSKPSSDRKLILVVEDSPVQALALTKLLERNGVDVLCAANGQTGVAMARCYLPDLVVLDVQMPEMNGLEACKRIKANPTTQDIPVILFTAHADLDVMKAGIDQGAVDFIPKDAFSDVVLLETLRQLRLLPESEAASEASTGRTTQEKGV